MSISARNQLRGKIEEIRLGEVMAHVVVRVGDNLIESVITRRSADELKLKNGDTVTAVVKATEVMIQKDPFIDSPKATLAFSNTLFKVTPSKLTGEDPCSAAVTFVRGRASRSARLRICLPAPVSTINC